MSEDIELFAGPGGWSEGARLLGMPSALGFEIDPVACATARAAGHRRVECDVTLVDPLDHRFRRGVVASPVCTGLSMAGKGLGRLDRPYVLLAIELIASGWLVDDVIAVIAPHFADKHSRLILEPLRFISAINPEWTAWEQVPAALPLWQACAVVLRAWGYSVWTGNMNAERYGVPQTRTRAVLIASRLREVSEPPATHSRYYTRDPSRLDAGVPKWVSMAEALGWGATARPGMTITAGGTGSGGGGEPFGSHARAGLARELDAERWEMRSNYTKGGDLTGRLTRPVTSPSVAVTGKYQRANDVSWMLDQPATTVQGDPRIADRDGHDRQFGASAMRVTPQEAAVLQSFRADYPWQGTKTKQFQQIGNAVPPLLAAHILAMATGLTLG